MDFTGLVKSIADIHNSTRGAAATSVNHFLTKRNWLIGMYIVEYEQNGEDRAEYGSNLIPKLSLRLSDIRGFSERNLRLFREFYRSYPQISQSVTAELTQKKINGLLIPQKPSAELLFQIQQKPSVKFHNHIDNKSVNDIFPAPENLIKHFSFSHFVELMRITNPFKRAFYEIEGINGCWSVPPLKRQIESQLYGRTGLSRDKAGLIKFVHAQGQVTTIVD
jgi:hypothetical protein